MLDHSYDIPYTEFISHINYNAQLRICQILFTLVKRDLNHKVTVTRDDLK
jgi:hypothetical protein